MSKNKNIFTSIKVQKPKKNFFDLSHDFKFSMDMGNLVPICNIDCVPGDKFNLSCQHMVRFAPMIAPMMHRVDVTMHYFFVPYRLLWTGWEYFITGTAGEGTPGHVMPYFPVGATQDGDLADYLGIPAPNAPGPPPNTNNVSALHFAAYQLIYKEYYRSQQLENAPDDLFSILPDGLVVPSWLPVLRRRAWEHDYFTSALPQPQAGDAVSIPVGELGVFRKAAGGATQTIDVTPGVSAFVTDQETVNQTQFSADQLWAGDQDGTVGTINDLRRANALQRFLERMNISGSRYVEQIWGMFGVRSSDARLNRPEYIYGTKNAVQVSDVVNTSGGFDPTDPDVPSSPVQGNLAGYGLSSNQSGQGKYFCEEHGVIMGIMSVMPKTAYQQGIAKKFQKFDRFDYFWPQFANIGEQGIRMAELYRDAADPDEIFGYVPRYTEYKFENSRVAGAFRSSLNYWHMGRIFDTEPALNSQFIISDPTKRIFAVEDDNIQSLYCHVYNSIKAFRPMPKFGTPAI